jgi:division protein CdvB (Snf7/Vps24/ESCRT-III family)
MSRPSESGLREGVEAWEREAAAYWDNLTRSPDFLRRVGYQLSRSLKSQQQITASFESFVLSMAGMHEQSARELYLLEQLEQRLDVLAERIEQLEQTLSGDDD